MESITDEMIVDAIIGGCSGLLVVLLVWLLLCVWTVDD